MSAGHDDGSSIISIGLGTLVPTALSTVIGGIVAVALWAAPSPYATGLASFSNFFVGLFVGLVMGFFVGWFMSWNAYVMGSIHERSPLASAWGVVPGLLFGASLGPIFGGSAGIIFGHLVDGALFGLFMGPIVGVLAWEIGFFLGNLFRSEEQHH